jgi:hypothetical protein
MKKTKFSPISRNMARGTSALVAVALASAALGVQAAQTTGAGASGTNASTSTYGSGKLYKTTVERTTQGELSAEDLHQASLLSSQLLSHVNEAAQRLTDGRADSAKAEMETAESLAKLVRGLLPVTVVTTTVKDAQGKELYRNVQRVQDDQIPIFERAIAVEVVEPIVEAKKDQAALKGLKLADADLIHTAVLVDLSYIERKLRRAQELIAKPQEAALELALAQSEGIRFFARKEDSPLVNVQHALRLAERMVREKKFEGAKANLQLARIGLETYRGLVDEAAAKPVSDLEKEIQKISAELQSPGAAERIRSAWDKVAGLFRREPGQAHETTPQKEKEPRKPT